MSFSTLEPPERSGGGGGEGCTGKPCDKPESLMTPQRPWTVGHAKRDGVGLGVDGSLHSVLLCKADPAGLPADGGRGRGVTRGSV